MEMNTSLIQNQVTYLEGECIGQIRQAAGNVEQFAALAAQCMDSENGRQAAQLMNQIMETILSTLPQTEEAIQKLVLLLKRLAALGDGFHM